MPPRASGRSKPGRSRSFELSTRSLDLSALSSAAPRTRIDAQADVQTAGLDKPARALVNLRNHEPGRLDDNRVPVRELRVELGATPKQLDRIEIQRIEAQLADDRASAGRVTGSGQWSAADLRLQLQLSGVEPARLHRQAGAMRVGGTAAIQLRGVPLPTAGGQRTRHAGALVGAHRRRVARRVVAGSRPAAARRVRTHADR